MYSIGQKVVCIDDQFCDSAKKLYTALPVKNVTYTVRDVLPGIALDNKTHEVAVRLEELTNPLNSAPIPQERSFNIERFAPLNPNYEVEVDRISEPIEHGDLVGV